MKVYMVKTTIGTYCVFSENKMNRNNNNIESGAIEWFESDLTFDPSHINNNMYRISKDNKTIIRSSSGSKFGTILYELYNYSPSTYEFF